MKTIHPWPVVRESEPVVSGNKIKLTDTWFRNPETGREQLFPMVTQVRGDGHGSLVIPVTKDFMVVTIWEWMQALGAELQFVPSGVAEYVGEPPEAVARRELLEEAGLVTEQLISLGDPFIRDPRNIRIWSHPFLALDCRQANELKPEEGELIETELIPLEEWIRMAMSPRFPEPAVAAATFRALPYLPKKIVRKALDFL